MADVTIAELIERTRLESGLRNNQYYDTDQILRYLNAGGAELHDIFVQANEHYVINEFDFTPTAGDGVIALPEDFQQGHSLDIYPDVPGQTRTIRFLSNWLDRNQAVGAAYFLAPGGTDPVYTFMGGNIRFYPPNVVPAAPFRLYYTPQWEDLAEEVTRDIEIDAADHAQNDGGFIQLVLTNGAFVEATDIGASITVNWQTANDAFDVTGATITAVAPGNDTTVTVNVAWPGGSFTNPATGTASLAYQPIGTLPALPGIFAPWSEYLVVYAAMAINIDRQRPIGELERKLQALKARIASTIGNRQEEPQQPPLTRGVGLGWWGGGGWQ